MKYAEILIEKYPTILSSPPKGVTKGYEQQGFTYLGKDRNYCIFVKFNY